MATTQSLELSVELEKTSSILRKMKVKVPAKIVKNYFDKGLVAIQKTANLKGFRPGQAPVSIIKQYYGEDVRHRIMHNLIDDSFEEAVRGQELKAVGSPKIDTPHNKTGEGAHDHTLNENEDLTYEATFEVMPDLQVTGYSGVALDQDKIDVTEEQVTAAIENLRQSQAQLNPVTRSVQSGDFVDTQVVGGLVTETGVEPREDMKGNKLIEVGGNQWIPGFDDQLVGMSAGETKTFRVTLPKTFAPEELAEKEVEFTATVNEVKEKKLPTLDEDFAKQVGYESVTDLQARVKDYLVQERTEESGRKARSALVASLIEKNPFDVPMTLIEGQTRTLAQEWAQELKKQGFQESLIQSTLQQEFETIRKRAESQVRASLLLEAVAKKEAISIQPEELDAEVTKIAEAMKVEKSKLQSYYAKNPGRLEDLEFRLRQERTLKFLLEKAKINWVSPSEK